MTKLHAVATLVASAIAVFAALPAVAGYKDGMDALAARNYAKARAEFEAERSDAKALYELGRMARLGLGEPRNDARATNLLREAAELGHVDARLDYAYSLATGRGVAKDPAAAIKALEALAESGNTEAMVSLGRAARFGWWDQPKDEAKSVPLFQRAMDAGDDGGRLMMVYALLNGIGVAKDEARAASLLQPAVERGHVDSQLEFARMQTFGVGMPRDEAAGTALYRTLAERGNRVAQYSLGMAHLHGRGIPRDERTGARWIDASARQGWAWAQVQLGDLYRQGRGLPVVRTEAYYWYSVAARGSTAVAADQANAQRKLLGLELSEAQLARQASRVAAYADQPGFKPRITALPPPSRTDRIELGPTSVRVPQPAGFINAWQTVEWMQNAFPNDPDVRPWLLAYNAQEDADRMKLGLPGRVRSIEVARHLPNDDVKITTTLFTDIKTQLRTQFDAGIAGARFRAEGVVRDDEQAFSALRGGITDPNQMDALSYIVVREKVLMVAFTGFHRDQKAQLGELVKSLNDEILSANRPGLFSR